MLLRQLLLATIAAAPLAAADAPARILLFTRSQGYEHSVIKPGPDGTSLVERTLATLGKGHAFTIIASKDGGLFTPEKLKEYDAFAFYTTGDLTKEGGDKNPPMGPGGKQALFDAIKAGKGFIGFHSATDTFHGQGPAPDPYAVMIGGEFITHGSQQAPKVTTTDASFPGVDGFGAAMELTEEWYSLKQLAKDLHVVQVLDTSTMQGWMYQRPRYPVTWIHPYGKGRVFYTAIGHRDESWSSPVFQKLVASGIDYALHRITVNDTPNMDAVAPEANTLPLEPPKTK